MLKNLMVVPLLALPLSSFAWGTGIYVGAGIAADTTNYDIISYPQKTGDFNVINRVQLGAQGVMGDIFGGVSWHDNWFYLAGELNGNLSSAGSDTSNEEKLHNAYSITTYKINESWGIGILPGIILPQDTLFYARAGYVDGHFKETTSDTSLANNSTWLNGLRLGLGIDKRVYNNWDLRLEYSHISYEQESSTVYLPASSFTKKTDITPDSNQVELGLVYRVT